MYTLFNVKRISTVGKRQISKSRRMLRAVLCTFVIYLAFGGGAATGHLGLKSGVRPTLRDNPFQGNQVAYLTGEGAGAWKAWTSGPLAERKCAYEKNVDFDIGSVTGKTDVQRNGPVTTEEACCVACFETAECAASVFNTATSECWLKNQTQLKKRVVRAGRVACLKEARDGQEEIVRTQPPAGALVVPATVPGDLITDLENAGQIQDPLHEMNFLNNSLWEDNSWTYSTSFSATKYYDGTYVLVFDGIKMGARIAVNGVQLGTVTDQFLRYRFPLAKAVLQRSATDQHVLTVQFDKTLKCAGRWMACTGGWDWAPYSHTAQEGANTFSKGIWKDVYLVQVNSGSAAIEHFVPHVFYNGPYPASALREGHHGDFRVHLTAHLWSATTSKGSITFRNEWGDSPCTVPNVVVPVSKTTMVNCSFTATASQIRLWWPNNVGKGTHPLYGVSVEYVSENTASVTSSPVSTSRKIGFRTFAIVTGPDENPSYVNASVGKEGTENNGMFFRVNGAAVFARGANMIPMEELEGRADANALHGLVKSAADAGFNILRNWGGGVFQYNAWYDACDEFGIMIYHDMMFAQRGHSPQVSKTEELEFRHQARRLAQHPSIVIWDGCNECKVDMSGPTAIYATFLLTVIAEEDRMRSIWPACPAAGWKSGVDRLTSRPTGTALETQYLTTMETHGPYQHGLPSNFPSTDAAAFNFSDNCAPTNVVATDVMGTQEKNIFASEFGSVVMSSFESMSAMLSPEHWALHGGAPYTRCESWPCTGANPMVERNYECTPLIRKWFGDSAANSLNTTGETAFKRQLYQCMLGQALEMKSNIEHRRSTNVFGIIVWQFNEIWPTGGWGSIEYGTPGKQGQVIGGRWKPLHYFYESHLYRDVIAVCGSKSCYVKNDGDAELRDARLVLETVDLRKRADNSDVFLEKKISLGSGPGVIQHFEVDFSKLNFTFQVVSAKVVDSSGQTLSSNLVTMTYPKFLTLPKATVTATVRKPAIASSQGYDVEVKTDGPALYIMLTTTAQGRFSENCFFIPGEGTKVVKFLPFVEEDQYPELEKSLRVEHVGEML